eukprot:TRINITY_DN498_c0_g1_i1.p1 TRINITY_DN498_c0_g1~~TRINITY_DN498_c0_g1_i1.p1  ORF type:complete len:198 (+),score=53.17 TRINITY_DN498_c0_g1_i1:83-676(+)
MFSWLSGSTTEAKDPVVVERKYNRTRFLLEAFYSLYCPDLDQEVDELCVAVDSKLFTLDEVVNRLCSRFEDRGAILEDWTGPQPKAVIKYRIDRFYLTYDPPSLPKSDDLVQHVVTNRYPLTVVLTKMCAKFENQGAVLANWVEDYPVAMRKPVGEAAPEKTYKEGDSLMAVIDGRIIKGKVIASAAGEFTVKFATS